MKLTVVMDTNGPDFAPHDEPRINEVFAATVRSITQKVAQGITEGRVYDANGNYIGTWEVNQDDNDVAW